MQNNGSSISVDEIQKNPPPYAIRSVDHALRLAAMLQLEGELTVSEAAQRLGVARSTAHRLLAMLVYRDFAVKDDQHGYRAGLVLELAAHSPSETSRLRSAALPHLQHLVERIGESANLAVRTGDTTRFIASVESHRALRVSSREGMVFPAHRTTAGLLLLAELPTDELGELYAQARYEGRPDERPDLRRLRADLARVRRNGFALNHGRSERGVVAIGVPVHEHDGTVVAGLSVSMPSVRYERGRLPELVTTLRAAARTVEGSL
ncbi:transcriptional regulator [Saccharomonospora cyanea NA-134]|uniref:Transcriptional regulator n=1 Tax=Saccharomonospora cyanea NA-134 TaxID=882082 RepID=H5XLG4_9PSEU|nr:IclR family transcriptional regulator [Saccharomonospora cyanea]EHR59833.1 transcriptional regulator [Saccharomonospora cyanea NA-134]